MPSDLLQRIERHLLDAGMSTTRFGRSVVGDPRFVADLRAGRCPREQTVAKVQAYFESQDHQ
jgi:hypothetical protein